MDDEPPETAGPPVAARGGADPPRAADVPELPSRIDHTVLGPTTTPADVERVVAGARALGTNVCVPPRDVDLAREALDEPAAAPREGDRAAIDRDPLLVTVVGFPHGHHASSVAVAEARAATDAGADELDAVMAVGRLLAGEDESVRAELAALTDAVDVPVKAIVGAPLLDAAQLDRACEHAAATGCSHVKTATGFNGGGATVADVERMAEHLPVKASGGIGSWERAREVLAAGAARIGASSGDAIVREWRAARGSGP